MIIIVSYGQLESTSLHDFTVYTFRLRRRHQLLHASSGGKKKVAKMLASIIHLSLFLKRKKWIVSMAHIISRKDNQSNVRRSDFACRDQEKLVVTLTLKLKAIHSTRNMHFRVTANRKQKVPFAS